MFVKLKVVHSKLGDVRKFNGNFSNYFDCLSKLVSFVSLSYGYEEDEFVLTYKDDENDFVTITSGSDLEDALKKNGDNSKTVRIYVSDQKMNDQNRETIPHLSSNIKDKNWYLPHGTDREFKKEESNEIRGSIAGLRTINKIRQIVDKLDMSSLEDNGKEFISLSIGDPTKYPNLRASSHVTSSVSKILSSHEWNGYGPSSGLYIAKEALYKKFIKPYPHLSNSSNIDSDIYLTSGCSDALNIAFCSILDENDTILLPKPGFSLYETLCNRYNFNYIHYNCLADKEWEIDLTHLESLIVDNKNNKNSKKNKNIKAILVNNPSNPCGSVLSRDNLLGVLSLCEKYNLIVISDEVYDSMVFSGVDFYRLGSLTRLVKVPVITVGGLAKQYLVPGWRVGWILLYDPLLKLTKAKESIHNLTTVILGPNTMMQAALPSILLNTPKEYYIELNNCLQEQALCLYDHFESIKQLRPIKPKGAMYLMTEIKIDELNDIEDDIDFANKLLNEESILVLPGTIFGMPNFFRSVVCPPIDVLDVVGQRMKQFCQKHRKNDKAKDATKIKSKL